MAGDGPEAIVARACALVGVPFRLHGRDANGLDCVGLIAAAHGRDPVPTGYALQTRDPERLERGLAEAGFVRVDAPGSGNVLILNVGPAQLHLGLWTGDALIHADAGLRRVVETPGWPRWPVLSIWRG